MRWILEPGIARHVHEPLARAAVARGHTIATWDDAYGKASALAGRIPEAWHGGYSLFHGSLQAADSLARDASVLPGAFCNTPRYHCSAWYPDAAPWLLQQRWAVLPVSELVHDKERIFADLRLGTIAFVRPDSPLKPFSGRLVGIERLTLGALGHGSYYDDPDLAVVIAQLRTIQREWRYVACRDTVIAGSSYIADGRSARDDDPSGAPWNLAQTIAASLTAPDPLWVIDICESDGALHLLELNPFSGADLYACDVVPIVDAVDGLAQLGG